MDIRSRIGNVLEVESGLAILGVFENDSLPPEVAQLLDPADFTGKAEKTALLYPRGAVAPARLILLGLGDRAKFGATAMRRAMAVAIKRARDLKVTEVTVGVLGEMPLDSALAAKSVIEGLEFGSYRYAHFQTELSDDQKFVVESAVMLVEESNAPHVAAGLALGLATARGTQLARDLVNSPSYVTTPATLADEALKVADRFGLATTVLAMDELVAQGFGGIVAVGKGSANEPRFISMEYGTAADDRPTICLVGKGLTFDSGGLNIKPGDSMETMKHDMSGAAAVIGTMQAVAELGLPIHLVGLIGAAENMPSGSAYRPGDIVKALSGKTVEVLNTDAEGRIVLADVLFYAQRYEPDAIIDIATLTGAVIVALGPHAIGLVGTDQALVDSLREAGEATGERAWQLPLWDEYREMVQSDIADIKNIASGGAGTVTAAAFLANFVGEYPWAHLDIAGTAWVAKPEKPYQSKGGTGVGVRLLVEYLRGIVA